MGDPKFPPHEQQEHDHACRGQPHYRVGGPSPGGPLSYGQEHRTEADYEEACSRPVDGFEAAVTPEGRKDLRRQPNSYQTDGKVNVCLLYTSDAADDLTRVNIGGRRI